MGYHVDTRAERDSKRKKKNPPNADRSKRAANLSFKAYLKEIREEELVNAAWEDEHLDLMEIE